jgi:signal transduction histidine kinase
MGEVVADAAASVRPACAEKRIDLAIRANEDGGPAFGSPDRLTQVVLNLLGNAVKFTPEGGRIEVTVRREALSGEDPDAPPPAVGKEAWAPFDASDTAAREYVRVDVRDTGPGMSAEIRQRLFEKFAQGGRKRGKGVGLGLYISREIIRRHGGTIWVNSELGQGSTFSFRIPLLD